MSSADSLNAWFNNHLHSLPTVPLPEDQSLECAVFMLFEDLPIGITEYNVPYRSIPFRRSGAAGWTYFPISDSGERLARVSYMSPKPNVFVRALVKLVNYQIDGDNESCIVAERAILIIDNLNGHGRVEMRQDNPANKRRKLNVKH